MNDGALRCPRCSALALALRLTAWGTAYAQPAVPVQDFPADATAPTIQALESAVSEQVFRARFADGAATALPVQRRVSLRRYVAWRSRHRPMACQRRPAVCRLPAISLWLRRRAAKWRRPVATAHQYGGGDPFDAGLATAARARSMRRDCGNTQGHSGDDYRSRCAGGGQP